VNTGVVSKSANSATLVQFLFVLAVWIRAFVEHMKKTLPRGAFAEYINYVQVVRETLEAMVYARFPLARDFARDSRAVGAVISAIILLAALMIAAIVFSQLATQASNIATANNDTAALNFIHSTATTGWSALNLYVISVIVLAAGFILSLLAAWGRSGSGGV